MKNQMQEVKEKFTALDVIIDILNRETDWRIPSPQPYGYYFLVQIQ